MEIILEKKPKGVTIIEGFPGFGLIGTIGTEFLIEHLNCEKIGRVGFKDISPVIALHDGKMVEPLGVFYSKKYNIVVIHIISAINGQEWKIADAVKKIAEELKAKEIVSIEGVGCQDAAKCEGRIFYYSTDKKREEIFEKSGIKKLKEGIIIGATAAIFMNIRKMPLSCIFAETSTGLPDSKAAAKIIEALDKVLGLKVDARPLLEQAEVFEQKLQGIISKSKEAEELKDKKKLSYVG